MAVPAKPPPLEICGSGGGDARRIEQRHLTGRAQLRRFAATGSLLSLVNSPASAAATVDTPGNVAVMSDADGIRVRRNPFNLQLKMVAFQPLSDDAASYKVESGETGFDRAAAAGGNRLAGLGDDDTREIQLPFSFRYFGADYSSVFVNSDGNLTFGSGDDATADRSLSRMIAGAPRIAPLFSDLDPSQAGAAVSALAEADRFVITWSDVPFFEKAGLHTFQVVLRPSGRIEFCYGDTSIFNDDVVVGISPGGLRGEMKLAGLASGADSNEYAGGVAEVFTGRETYDVARAVQRFYATHDDAFDVVFVFNALSQVPALCPTAIACTDVIRNRVTGSGQKLLDDGGIYGSAKRLEAVIDMGFVDGYPNDPYQDHPQRLGSGDKGINIFGHEASHRYLVWLKSPTDAAGNNIYTGRQGLHWNFNFNSEGSLVEGNRIVDQGEGANPRFFSAGAGERIAPVDQYYFGWRAAADVPATFVVRGSSVSNPSAPPSPGARFNGARQDVTIEELMERSGGPRYPDSAIAPRKYRWGFILITREGQAPPAAGIAKLERYIAELPGFWDRVSEGRSQLDVTSSRLGIDASFAPHAELEAGQSAQAAVRIARPLGDAVTIAIERDGAEFLDVSPESVTIPAGETSAAVTLTAKSAGVTAVTLRVAADARFEALETRIRVSPSRP